MPARSSLVCRSVEGRKERVSSIKKIEIFAANPKTQAVDIKKTDKW